MPTIIKHIRPVWLGERKPFETTRVTRRWDGYNTADWKAFRKWFRSAHPICATPGCGQATYYVDHVIPVLQYIAQGGSPLDATNCQPLCYKCGNSKTGKEGRAKQLSRK